MGYIAWVIILYGAWLIGEKRVAGFYINLCANVLLGVDSVIHGYYPNLVACLAFFALGIINIRKWSRPGSANG